MAKSQVEVNSFIRKLYRFLDSGHKIGFKPLRGLHGIIFLEEFDDQPTSAEIILDPRKAVFSTVIHEVIHYIYPEWCETDVLRYEAEIVNNLTERQVKNIIKRLARAL